MAQPLTLEQLKHALRLSICGTCKFRPSATLPSFPIAGSSCESRCPIFTHLVDLRDQALLMDPMFSRHHAMARRVAQFCREDAEKAEPTNDCRDTPLTQYGEKVAKIVAHACEW